VEPLIAALEDEGKRYYAAEALGEIRDARAVEPLTAALWDEDEDVRELAAEALDKIGDAHTVEDLRTGFRDEDGVMREGAAIVLHKDDVGATVESADATVRAFGEGGFFVFDYNVMDIEYGQQAFEAIRDGLSTSLGTCAFCDGDVSTHTAQQLAQQCRDVFPKSSDSPLSEFEEPFEFGAYLAAMWTDVKSNFEGLHYHLCSVDAPGYLGYLTLDGQHELVGFVRAAGNRLHLTTSIIFVNGAVVPQTSKYGIR